MKLPRTLLALLLLMFSLSRCMAQFVQTETLLIYPMAESDTPLALSLLPPLTAQTHDNAAEHYGRVETELGGFVDDDDFQRGVNYAAQKTLSELQHDLDLKSKFSDGNFLNALVAAGRCDSIDWKLPIRKVPIAEMNMSVIYGSRQYASILAAQTRFQIADGDFESASKFAQANFALARNVGEAPIGVGAALGLSIQDAAARSLIDWVQQPQAPNLYWSLAVLPDPLVNIHLGIESQLASLDLSFPWLAGVLEDKCSAKEWNLRLDGVWETLRSGRVRRIRDVALDELVVFGYPIAKRRLLASGVPSERLEAMHVAQVLLADMFMEDKKLSQQIVKWINIPYPDSYMRVEQLETEQMNARGFGLNNLAVASRIPPSNILTAGTSVQQLMAMLKIVEALRMDSTSRGSLPKSLDEISYPPIPNDPVTGKAFEYKLTGQKAVLTAGQRRDWSRRWEIELAHAPIE